MRHAGVGGQLERASEGTKIVADERGSNFFKPGGTLEPAARSYVHREADERLLELLMAGDYVFLLDSRQKGKSSLVARTIVRLRDAGFATIKLDLQRIGANVTVEQWYAGLLAGFGQETGLTTELFAYWADKQSLGPLARLVGALDEVVLALEPRRVIVIVDEADFVRALPFSTDEFFAAVRDCFNRRSDSAQFERLSFCLVGVATPGQLIRNPEITPFNVGTRLVLTDFSAHELEGYATVLDNQSRDGPALIKRVHYWLGGHPYLTQLLCSYLARDSAAQTPGDVDDLVAKLFFAPEARQHEPNFADVERRVLYPDIPGIEQDEARTRMLEFYGRLLKGQRVEVDIENPVIAALLLSGIASEQAGRLVLRNRVYQTVFSENWRRTNLPDAEVRRQRAAARRTGLRVGLVALGVVTASVSFGLYANALRQESQRQEALANYEAYCSGLTIVSQYAQDGHWQGIVDTVSRFKDSPYAGWEYDYWLNEAREHALADDDGRAFDWRWSRDGKSVISRHPDGIRFFDPATGKIVKTMKASPVVDFAAAIEVADGNILDLHWTGDSTLYSREGEPIWTKHVGNVHWRPDAMVSPDGRYVTGNVLDEAWVLDTVTGGVKRIRVPGHRIWRGVFGSKGGHIVAVCRDTNTNPQDPQSNAVVILDGRTLAVKKRFWPGPDVQSVMMNEHSGLILAGAEGGMLHVFEADTLLPLQKVRIGSVRVWRMSQSRDGRLLSACDLGGESKVFEVVDRRLIERSVHTGFADLKWSPDGRAALASYTSARILSTSDLMRGRTSVQPGMYCIDPFRSALHSLTPNGVVATYRLTDRAELVQKTDLVKTLRLVPPLLFTDRLSLNAQTLFVVDSKGTVVGLDLATYVFRRFGALPFRGTFATNGGLRDRSFAVNITEGLAYRGVGLKLEEWQLPKGTQASGVQMSDDGRYFLVSSARGLMSLWDFESGTETLLRDSVPFTANGHFALERQEIFLGNDNGELLVYNLGTKRLVRRGGRHAGNVVKVALSPDRTRVASCGDDKTVRIWDADTLRLLTVLRGHASGVMCVVWLDGGKTLLSVDSAGDVRWWRTSARINP